ncbi:MAG TPA: DJ-1/PfpI family protein [Candidatus Competibacter sp.]|jgi:putative intracellular protease/amidase|nr:DJ-1/PfpI family protein [Candidatus Competibacter sp.]HRX61725.1 DJ-1/PfpI family protein [Candidatus Competibacter sp.]
MSSHSHPKRIAIMIESHFDDTEPGAFTMFFPANGYSTEFISNLRGAQERTFKGNDSDQEIRVTKDLDQVRLEDYSGLILVGGYAMDMLRYEVHVDEGQPNEPKATQFMRRAFAADHLLIGTICHSLWLLTPAPDLLQGRKVTCSHNIMHDIRNTGAVLVYDQKHRSLADTHVDGRLITARHPYVVAAFMNLFLEKLNERTAK